MLQVSLHPYRLTIHESVGLTHEPQVVEITIPEASPAAFCLSDETSGRLYPVQSSQQHPGKGYLLLSIEPHQVLNLVPVESTEPPILDSSVSIEERNETWLVKTKAFEIEVSSGKQVFGKDRTKPAMGPVRRVRECSGPWRGRTFFDTANEALREQAEWREKGPLRVVYHYRIEFFGGGFYELDMTIDASGDFARLHETFQNAAADQIVWDFSGDDLPERVTLLDTSAGYTSKWVHYHMDQRHARLWCWTQNSQLHDLSDGYAIHFSGADDAVGFVTLEGGKWHGNALNHVECWTRRWQAADITTRRLPADTKADSFPGTDCIPARGHSVNQPHFSLEGWLRKGERYFALVISTGARLAPLAAREGGTLEHFEWNPRRDIYRLQQGRLRKIQIQHGVLPLQDQLEMAFQWPLEKDFTAAGRSSSAERRHISAIANTHDKRRDPSDPDQIKRINDYLQARVFGFWEGSGCAYTNCVVSRLVGPDMLQFESLAAMEKLTSEQITHWRNWFSFLAHLFHSDNYYPGGSTMEPMESDNSVEPTIAGMSNQNFFTDVFTLSAFGAQVFPEHPSAAAWRARFVLHWKRQLEYHMFPKSGVWEESHTYYQHVLNTVLPLLMRKKIDGDGDGFADTAFQKLVAAAIPQFTPRNAVTEGSRHLVLFGDHGADPKAYRTAYRELARGFAPHAPVLAGNLAWAYQEMKGEEILDVPAIAPKFSTGYLEGLGFFFRTKDAAGEECLLALRSGMAWGHHHSDDGSIQFYAHGRALIVDSASSQPQERGGWKALAPGHSRTVVEGIEPLNHLWRFNRGWILDSQVRESLSYAVAGVPTFATLVKGLLPSPLNRAFWELRAVVELAPTVFLIADYLDASQAHITRFHVAHEQASREGSQVSALFADGCHLKIEPLSQVNPPSLSVDRPLNPEKLPQEITTAVEYVGITGPWSLFVVSALGSADELKVSVDSGTTQINAGGKEFKISHPSGGPLEISSENEADRVTIAPELLLAKLRKG